jgi:hypothetical protein
VKLGSSPVKHGLSGHPLYATWKSMRERCNNPRSRVYPRYGGRGIKVCKRWDNFALFLKDVGVRPTSRHWIERKDNDGDYEPGNVEWALPREQNRNQSRNVWVEFRGEKATLVEWSEKTGIRYWVLKDRLNRGWAPEKALTAKVQEHRKKRAITTPKQGT